MQLRAEMAVDYYANEGIFSYSTRQQIQNSRLGVKILTEIDSADIPISQRKGTGRELRDSHGTIVGSSWVRDVDLTVIYGIFVSLLAEESVKQINVKCQKFVK